MIHFLKCFTLLSSVILTGQIGLASQTQIISCEGVTPEGGLRFEFCVAKSKATGLFAKKCPRDAGVKVFMNNVQDEVSYFAKKSEAFIHDDLESAHVVVYNDGLELFSELVYAANKNDLAWNTLKITRSSSGQKILLTDFSCQIK